VRITAASALRGSNSSRPGTSLLLLLLAPSAAPSAVLLLLLAGYGSARPAMRLMGRKPSLLRAVDGVAQRLQGKADSLSIWDVQRWQAQSNANVLHR
jgi:hypothetical protein